VLAYAKAHKKYEWDVTEAANSELFNNQKIKRRLSPDGISAVFGDLVKRGNGEWASSGSSKKRDKGAAQQRITLFWRRPEEWGAMIFKWVVENGKTNSVLTVFEIQQGEDVEKEGWSCTETGVADGTFSVVVSVPFSSFLFFVLLPPHPLLPLLTLSMLQNSSNWRPVCSSRLCKRWRRRARLKYSRAVTTRISV
jgi:ESCRT-II complex subunit